VDDVGTKGQLSPTARYAGVNSEDCVVEADELAYVVIDDEEMLCDVVDVVKRGCVRRRGTLRRSVPYRIAPISPISRVCEFRA